VASSLVISAAETNSCSDHEGASQDRKRGPSQGVAEEIVKQPKQTPAQLAGERKTKFASDKDGLLSSFIYCFYLFALFLFACFCSCLQDLLLCTYSRKPERRRGSADKGKGIPQTTRSSCDWEPRIHSKTVLDMISARASRIPCKLT